MSALRAAILIVNYRVYEKLDRALGSLAPYLGDDDEVVVFDQVSEADRLEPIVRRHSRVRTIASAANVGFAAAVNAAARTTRARYLLLLNPDAIVEGPVVAVLTGWLDAHPGAGIVGPRIVDWDGTVQASARRFPGPSAALAGRSSWMSRRFPGNWLSRRNLLTSTDQTRGVDWLAGSCFLTRHDLFDRLGGFDERFFLYWEDADYCRRARAIGFDVVYVPSVSVRHEGGASAAGDRAQAIRAFHQSAAHLYRKHAGRLARPWAPVVAAGLWARGEWKVYRASRR
jgi:GT2 family glycosyltransferase